MDNSLPDDLNRLVIGIGPMPDVDPRSWPEKDTAACNTYICELSKFAAWLIEQGHTIRFIVGEVHMDETAIPDICERIEQFVSASRGVF